jgi:FK506-binding nuclear protein
VDGCAHMVSHSQTFRNPGLFFGHSVSQDAPLEFRPLSVGVTLTAAVLGPEGYDGASHARSVLQVRVGSGPVVALCSFVNSVCENASLNLAFEPGASVAFTVRGPGVVHVSGRHFFDDENAFTREPSALAMDEDEEEHVGEEEEEEEDEGNGEKEAIEQLGTPAAEEDDENDEDEGNEETNAAAVVKIGEKAAEEPVKKRRRRAKEGEQEADVNDVKTIRIKGENLQYVDMVRGGGKPVRRGNKIRIRYTGRFADNDKIFDSSGRKCYTFFAGKGEVIVGLDAGVKGMMPGGKRKIFIPPDLAYGAEGAPPDIPPNSALVFEVEMVGFGQAKKTQRNQKRQSSPPRLHDN